MALRNCTAAADWLLRRRAEDPGLAVSVIAAGERWPDGSLRPAVEDLWGAGALIGELARRGWPGISPEARSAAAAFDAIGADVPRALRDCCGGRELVAIGFVDDVDTAAQLDACPVVPVLDGGAFRAG